MARQTDSAAGDTLDGLFQLTLPEFIKARNALASSLKKSGRSDEAARVQALPKPSASAWAVNQLHWRHRHDLEALLKAGDRFRDAQRAQLAGKHGDLRATLEARHLALSGMTTKAADLLRKAGHSPTPDLMRRVATTLEALATYGTLPDAPPVGRLTGDLETPGFEALASLIPIDGGSRRGDGAASRVIPFADKHPGKHEEARQDRAASKGGPDSDAMRRRREAQRVAARKAVATAEAVLHDARVAAREAEAALKKAATRTKASEKERLEAEARLAKASTAFDEATRDARKVARDAEAAAQAVSDAERDLEKARTALAADGEPQKPRR